MACEKHGYTNPTFCPACDLEKISEYETKRQQMRRRCDTLDAINKEALRIAGLEMEKRPDLRRLQEPGNYSVTEDGINYRGAVYLYVKKDDPNEYVHLLEVKFRWDNTADGGISWDKDRPIISW